MAIGKVEGLPRSSKFRKLTDQDIEDARYNNQIFLQGASPRFPATAFDEDYVVFIESVYTAAAGTFTLEGSTGVVSGAIPAPFVMEHSPVRFDGGVIINGTILGAKGFYIKVS